MDSLNAITYKPVDGLEDIHKVVQLQVDIWSEDVVSPQPQLVASINHGGVVIGAFDQDRLVGFCYGFAGFKDGESYLVSHMTGILPDYQNRGIGYQLKIKQREWAIGVGYTKMVWTYDPLEIRNGYFNLCKLGACSKTYIPSYYGEMNDKLNKGLPTDRLLVEWDICSKRVEDAIFTSECNPTTNEYPLLLNSDDTKECPTPLPLEQTLDLNQKGYLVSVPSNIQFMKQHQSDIALAWRLAVRTSLSKALSSGYIITGVRKRNAMVHDYVLEKTP